MVVFSQGHERQEHIEAASRAHEKAIEFAPTNPFYRVSLAALYVKAGKYENAVRPLQEALELEPNFVTARAVLMDVQQKLGNQKEATALKMQLEKTIEKVRAYRPRNDYEARLLMEPARYFAQEG